jgi:phosphorylcholine metabolism protein LicD|tara:strand:+ start:939 stop:1205 length:267 start_codon:yes stop_codon:yes gene_type:complete
MLQIFYLDGLIDITIYRKEKKQNSEMWIGPSTEQLYDNSFRMEDLDNLIPTKVYGRTFLIPTNSEKYLEKKYGKNWKIPNKKQFIQKK